MEEFLNLVRQEIGVDETVAKMAVGHVLAFLQKECSEGALTEFFDKVPGAKALIELVESEPASSSSVLGGLFSSGVMGLASKLNLLGLDMGQIQKLAREIFKYAETILGKEKVELIAGSIPGLSQFI
ncbi:MAG: DUF2267 domain-containing protein [Methylocystaceae bacterium]|nr:DUF2267 domain-containing protein [Methylocystaceae bacterium]NBT97173.1 DUF2267 domain-containing protein [Methylocystaceae bacterium]